MNLRRGSTVRHTLERVALQEGEAKRTRRRDTLATEEPLEIRLVRPGGEVVPVAVTMRTPGADFDLAAGFLFGEGVLDGPDQLQAIRYCVGAADRPQRYNIVQAVLSSAAEYDEATLQRNFYATSSCGVCGKASIEAVLRPTRPVGSGPATVSARTLTELPERLRGMQRVFDRTGGLHAAALFDPSGELLALREDVGRHNAMDKVVGAAFLARDLPLGDRIGLVSGRLSFELVQKAARAGLPILAGVSAPSSLAVELARNAGMTLVGFLRGSRFNVYTGAERIA